MMMLFQLTVDGAGDSIPELANVFRDDVVLPTIVNIHRSVLTWTSRSRTSSQKLYGSQPLDSIEIKCHLGTYFTADV
jgi:hypothetical protein